MQPYASFCDEFFLSTCLNTEMELPRSRDTVLHFFEQVKKKFPSMTNFNGRDPNEYVLEEDKDQDTYRWMALEPRRLTSGMLNPEALEDCKKQDELMLDLAEHFLSVTSLDCEALDVIFGFDFDCKGNHDQVVGEVFGVGGPFESLMRMRGTQLVNYEPNLIIALDPGCRLQARINVVTRTSSEQIRTDEFEEDPISVYFTIRQYWGVGTEMGFLQSYRQQMEMGENMVRRHLLPNVVEPLAAAISAM